MSNLKVDIIYHNTPSDFELEFNLSGCCRMRIFKDKTDSPRSLINALARDVARSRIILVVTEVLSENNGVEIISQAIGFPLEEPDKLKYGIKSSDRIRIPKGALPLVTKSGIYGGCIAESGPQSIIMISDNRELRHELMKSFIHQYIFDISQVEAYNERMKRAEAENALTPGAVSPAGKMPSDEKTENDITKADDGTDVTDTCEAPSKTEQEEPRETAEEAAKKEPPVHFAAPGTSPTVNSGYFVETDRTQETENFPRIKRKSSKLNTALLVISVLLLIGFGILAYYFVYIPLTRGEAPFFLSESAAILRRLLKP